MQERAPKGTRIAHVGIALESIAPELAFFREILEMEEVEVSDSDGAQITAFAAGESLVELLEPAGPDTPISRFVSRRGPGIHHICFAVDDLDATMALCRSDGVRLVDQVPRIGAEGKRIAFLHPSATNGVLIELSED